MQNRWIYRERKQISGYQELEQEGDGEWLPYGYGVSFRGDEKILELDSRDSYKKRECTYH